VQVLMHSDALFAHKEYWCISYKIYDILVLLQFFSVIVLDAC
jgi:hypothetical protein